MYNPAPGRILVAAGGTYISSLLVYTVIVSCDYTSIRLYDVYIHPVICIIVCVFARPMHSTAKSATTVLSKRVPENCV